MNGWLKLHRELIDKPIWKNSTIEQRVILITLLCMANHKPRKWEFGGEVCDVRAGQFITSIPSIVEKCESTEITAQKVRTALKRFEKLGFLTGKSTNKNRLITIINWEHYQDITEDDNSHANRQLTGNQQATNRRLTSNEEYKNIENVKNKELIAAAVEAAADNSSAISHYIRNINPTASPMEVEKLAIWVKELKGDDVVICAIDEAVMCNHRSLEYIKRILDRCEKQGIYTAEAFAAQKEEYRAQKAKKIGGNEGMTVKQTVFNSYEQRDYEEEEFEEIIRRKNQSKG